MATPRYQLALSRRTYTPLASSAATDHPETNLALPQFPCRTWVDDGTGVGSSVRCDLGASPPALAACVVYGSMTMSDRSPEATVTSWTVEESADGSTGWSELSESPLTVEIDARYGKRKGWFAITTSQRYVRFTVASGGLAAGATAAVLGVLDLYSSADLLALSQNPSDPQHQPLLAQTVFRPDGGGPFVNEDGPPRAQFQLGGRWFKNNGSVDELIQQIGTLGPNQIVALFENLGNSAEVYLYRVLGVSSYVPGNGAFVDMALQLEEVG